MHPLSILAIFSHFSKKNNPLIMKNILFVFSIVAFCIVACSPESKPTEPTAVYDSTPFDLKIGDFPTPNLPTDNKLTVAKIQLGDCFFLRKCCRAMALKRVRTAINKRMVFQMYVSLVLVLRN